MKTKLKISSIILLFLFIAIPYSFAQSVDKEKLKEDKERIEKEIAYANSLLDETQKNKKSTVNQIVLLNNKIKKREQLLGRINEEIKGIDNKVERLQEGVEQTKKDLKDLKDEYASLIYHAYINRNNYRRLAFIFSARDFNQAFQRLKYLQQYTAYRQQQAELIVITRKKLEYELEQLSFAKTEKLNLRKEELSTVKQLDQEKSRKNSEIQSLTAQENQLKKTIRDKEKAAKKLQSRIQEIIAEEIRLAAERANKKNNKKSFELTPEEQIISGNFQKNKGKIPWPVERGIVSSTYGEHAHPVLKHVKTKNNGIDILTNAGSMARAVFDGTVTRVLSIPNYHNVVIIRHGDFLTVYSNLDKVLVEKGQQIEAKQLIGSIYTDSKEGKTELHFELWKGKELQNPSYWIVKKK